MKSNNPHLTGGEKKHKTQQFPYFLLVQKKNNNNFEGRQLRLGLIQLNLDVLKPSFETLQILQPSCFGPRVSEFRFQRFHRGEV